ncbi:MAG TPA: patatin-like phospholipase family protein [Thermoanaerobaculia bacterium]|jgi:hypothetical protein|nr:patatin-like phospholipase family protein [Thermoanaerobaculia bacterium]
MARHAAATEFPLQLCEVLEEELAALLPESDPETRGSISPWEVAPDQIRAATLPALLVRLHDPGDEVSAWLRGQLSSDFLTLLVERDREDGPGLGTLRQDLADELNRLLHDEEIRPKAADLAQVCRGAGIRLSEEMERLLADPPKDRPHLLRLLLEEALPNELEPSRERRLQEVYRRVHAHPSGLAALCLSGGGIRSAVFSLGVVQGLARRGLLQKFDFLSTVSGGGYLGGLLSAWIHRHPRGLDGVADELGGRRPGARKLQPEAAPLEYLRNFSNYLTPKLGILSADSWTLISIFIRNLYVYWLVLVPLLLAALSLPRLYVAVCATGIHEHVPLDLPLVGRVHLFPEILFVLGSSLMALAIGYIGWNRPSGGRRSTTRGFLLLCLLPLVASATLFSVYWAYFQTLGRGMPSWTWFVFPTVSINIFGWCVHALPALAQGRVRPLAKLREAPFLVIAGTVGGLLAMLSARVFEHPTTIEGAPGWGAYNISWYGVFAVPCVLGAFVFGETLFAGLVSRWTDDEDREWWSRSAAWLLIVVAVWIALASVVIFGPVLLAYWKWVLTPVGGLAGIATALLARSSLTSESHGAKDKEGLASKVLDTALAFVAPVFVVILTAALSLGMSFLFRIVSMSPHPFFAPDPKAKDAASAAADALARWHIDLVAKSSAWEVFALFTVALVGGLGMALLIDINKFSLHAMYRNRLIRTFLGASREARRPNAFTGFDGEDDLETWRLRSPLFLRPENLADHGALLCRRLKEGSRPPSSAIVSRHLAEGTRLLLARYTYPAEPSAELLQALTDDFNLLIRGRFEQPLLEDLAVSEEERERLLRVRSEDERYLLQRDLLLRAFQEEIETSRPPKPLHVVNVALNLVGGKNLAWQQRKAESFTFSPLHCGSARVGYRAAETYARGGGRRRAVSLGTALAISGAAASSNMGYHSSPAITFLMTFWNARLGWWLGNPGVAGARTFGDAQPKLAIGPLISEALGLTDDRNPYVYLSDGGHFENLGLYEMVLRRCRYIVLVDAGQDHDCQYQDLGNALRKIRIDLGIHIQLGRMPFGEEPTGGQGRYCAVGKILYSEVDDTKVDGHLLYLKPAVYNCGEPQDVLNYKKLNKLFPHESTREQWFGEQQFESYRVLGLHAIDAICAAAGDGKIADLPKLFGIAGCYLGTDEKDEELEAEAPLAPARSIEAV